MATTDLYNTNNEKVGEVELNDELFAVKVNAHLLHGVVKMQLAAKRAGNACTKTRTEVKATSAKPFRQKGTGRARSGSRVSPLWRGGGVAFGPKPRDFSIKLPKKVRRLGLRMALSARALEGNIVVLDEFVMNEIKTKTFISVLNNFDFNSALIVVPESNDILELSSRNIPGVKVLPSVGLNVHDILNHKKLIILQNSLECLEKRLLS